MAEVKGNVNENPKPVLKKPPGFKDPNVGPAKVPVAAAVAPPLKQTSVTVPVQLKRAQAPQGYNRKYIQQEEPKRGRKRWCRTCCCFACIFMLIIIFIAVLAGGIFYLWCQPKLPSYHMQSLKISRFNVTASKDGTTYLVSQSVVKFQAKNRNEKIKFRYGETNVKLSMGDDDVELKAGVVPGFTQEKKNTTILKFGIHEKKLVDDDIGKKLKNQYKNKELMVAVEVRTMFGLGVGSWKMRMLPVRVNCGSISLKKLDAAGTPKCTINLLKWINIY